MPDTPANAPTILSIDNIHPDPGQPRKAFAQDALASLSDSMRRHGVLQPLRVHLVGSRWVIIDGHRRWLAAKTAGLSQVPVIVEERELGDAETTLQSVIANIQRSDLNPIERGEAIRRVMQLAGTTASAVAKDVGISEGTASKLLAILLLPEADNQRVRDGTLGLAAAYRLVSGKGNRKDEVVGSASRPRVRPARPKALRVPLGTGAMLVLRRTGTAALDALADTLTGMASRLRAAHAEGVLSPEFLASTPV